MWHVSIRDFKKLKKVFSEYVVTRASVHDYMVY